MLKLTLQSVILTSVVFLSCTLIGCGGSDDSTAAPSAAAFASEPLVRNDAIPSHDDQLFSAKFGEMEANVVENSQSSLNHLSSDNYNFEMSGNLLITSLSDHADLAAFNDFVADLQIVVVSGRGERVVTGVPIVDQSFARMQAYFQTQFTYPVIITFGVMLTNGSGVLLDSADLDPVQPAKNWVGTNS